MVNKITSMCNKIRSTKKSLIWCYVLFSKQTCVALDYTV